MIKKWGIWVLFGAIFFFFGAQLAFGDKYISPDLEATFEKLDSDDQKCLDKYLKRSKDCKLEYKDKEKSVQDLQDAKFTLMTCNDDALEALFKCRSLGDNFTEGKSLTSLKTALLKADKKRDERIEKCFDKNPAQTDEEVQKVKSGLSTCLKKAEIKYSDKVTEIFKEHILIGGK